MTQPDDRRAGQQPGEIRYVAPPVQSYGPQPGWPGAGYQGFQPQPASAVCSWHPDRPTGLSCTRCGRPACPECLAPASVGFQCRQCVAEGRSAVRQARTISGSLHGEQPLVTFVLIGLNVAVFLIMIVQARGEGGIASSEWMRQGALVPLQVADGDWWRLLTSGFLHYSVLHVAMNMLSLYLIGVGLERILGRVRFTVVYLLSLLGGSVAVYLFSGFVSATAGASGAIFGLLGALAVTFKRLNLDLRQLGAIIALNLVITFTAPGISWQAHLGGFVVGAIVGAAMVFPPAKTRAAWQWGVSVGVLGALVALVLVRAAALADVVCIGTRCSSAPS